MKVALLCQTLSCTCQRAFVSFQFTVNSLLLVYPFVSTLGFVPYAIFIYFVVREQTTEDRKIGKTRGDQKDSSREDEDQVKNRHLRILLNLNLSDKKWQS